MLRIKEGAAKEPHEAGGRDHTDREDTRAKWGDHLDENHRIHQLKSLILGPLNNNMVGNGYPLQETEHLLTRSDLTGDQRRHRPLRVMIEASQMTVLVPVVNNLNDQNSAVRERHREVIEKIRILHIRTMPNHPHRKLTTEVGPRVLVARGVHGQNRCEADQEHHHLQVTEKDQKEGRRLKGKV